MIEVAEIHNPFKSRAVNRFLNRLGLASRRDPNVSPNNKVVDSYIESIDGPRVSPHNKVTTPRFLRD